MGQLFLYGDIADTFSEITAPFVDAAVARGPTIALLLQGGPGWEHYVDRYRQPFEARSGVEMLCVVPDDYGTVSREALGVIDGAGGIFMGGGDADGCSGAAPHTCSAARHR